MTLLLIPMIIFLSFFTTLFYKLGNPDWYFQFIRNEFTSTDLFTKIVKFLLK